MEPYQVHRADGSTLTIQMRPRRLPADRHDRGPQLAVVRRRGAGGETQVSNGFPLDPDDRETFARALAHFSSEEALEIHDWALRITETTGLTATLIRLAQEIPRQRFAEARAVAVQLAHECDVAQIARMLFEHLEQTFTP